MSGKNEMLALIQDLDNPTNLSWHVVFVDFIDDVIPYLVSESDFEDTGNLKVVTMILDNGIEFHGGIEP